MNNKIKKNNQGVALIISILLMSLVLFLSLYFLSFTLTEKKISKSQAWGEKTYYLAEAGIHEMVWRLKNNEDYKNNFETNSSWSQNFSRVNPFGAGSGSYEVTISNSSLAHGIIVATGVVDIGGGKESQRIVKTYVYKALGAGGSEINDNCGYADGNIDISSSLANFYGGSAHSNNNFLVNGLSVVNVENDLNVVNNYNRHWLSTVNVGGGTYSKENPPAAEEIVMPSVDFDSEDSASYKNIADVVYSENDFDNLIRDNTNITLEGPITYVEGDVDLYGDKHLTINGLLVVERDFEVGRSFCRGSNCGINSITVNHTEGQPSGIFSKRKIYFKLWSGNTDVDGVIYASDQLDILSFPIGSNFSANGGLVSRKLTITSVWSQINIYYNEEIVNSTLGFFEFSPVITVEHWEEEY